MNSNRQFHKTINPNPNFYSPTSDSAPLFLPALESTLTVLPLPDVILAIAAIAGLRGFVNVAARESQLKWDPPEIRRVWENYLIK